MDVTPPVPRPGAAVFELTGYVGPRIAELGEEAAAAELAKALDRPGWDRPALLAAVVTLTVRMHHASLGNYEIEQTLGRALGNPEYGPEMFEDGVPNGNVCVGEHTPETLAAEAADRIATDTAAFEQIRLWLDAAHMAGPILPAPTRGELQLAELLGEVRKVVDGARPDRRRADTRKDPQV